MKHHGKLMAAALRDPTIVPHRILVIDGDCDIRRLCTDVLDGFGYRVDVASNGETGWEALRANQYNLLLTEEALPGVSGLELVGKMRAAHVALPVIMASERLCLLESRKMAGQVALVHRVPPCEEQHACETRRNNRGNDKAEDPPRPPDFSAAGISDISGARPGDVLPDCFSTPVAQRQRRDQDQVHEQDAEEPVPPHRSGRQGSLRVANQRNARQHSKQAALLLESRLPAAGRS